MMHGKCAVIYEQKTFAGGDKKGLRVSEMNERGRVGLMQNRCNCGLNDGCDNASRW